MAGSAKVRCLLRVLLVLGASALGALVPSMAAAGAGGTSPSPPTLPNPVLTPGDVLRVAARDICAPGYAKRARHVPIEVKRAVYARYGIGRRAAGAYEVDHLISLELGGSNSIRNLWPESYMTYPWNAHVKDRLENELHRRVCAGLIDLATAQREIATDWIAAYRRTFPDSPPQGFPRSRHSHRAPHVAHRVRTLHT